MYKMQCVHTTIEHLKAQERQEYQRMVRAECRNGHQNSHNRTCSQQKILFARAADDSACHKGRGYNDML